MNPNTNHFSRTLRYSSRKEEKLLYSLEFYGVCVFDDSKNRVLTGYYFSSQEMTVEMCLSICREKGFLFSGLEYGIECYCGNESAETFEWAWYGKCNDRCAGDSNQICGGSNAMSLYSTTKFYLNGLCVFNYPSPRQVFDGLSLAGQKNLTIEMCRNICQGS